MGAYDAANPKHISIQRRSEKAIADAKAAFLKHAMGMVDGRTFIHSLLSSCRVFESTNFSKDPYLTAFLCGQHSVGQQLLEDVMRVAPDEFVKMKREDNARELSDDTRRSRSDEDSNRDDPGPVYVHPAFDRDSVIRTDGDYNPVERDAEGDE